MWDAIVTRMEKIVRMAGNVASLLILVIMAAVTYEVVARYLFNAPTSWVWLINKQLFGGFVVIAGSYALMEKSHIRIEMFYDRFSPWMKSAVRWLTLAAAVCFLGSLVWKSGVMGLEAFGTREKATGVFPLPLYPLKLFIPLGTALFFLASLTTYAGKKKRDTPPPAVSSTDRSVSE